MNKLKSSRVETMVSSFCVNMSENNLFNGRICI